MLPHESDTPVLIIGGGAAGLATAASLAKRGIRSTILDQNDRIGASWSRRYHSLKLHTTRSFSGLPYYPIPKRFPRYLSKDEYASYLNEYTERLGLDISLNERVQEISPTPGNTHWRVLTNRTTRHAKVVVIATGQHAQANPAAIKGISGYAGTVLHSSEYTTGAEYKGKRALVIGMGNSGAEIAADLAAYGANTVSVSVRTAPPIVSREMFGIIPVQILGILLTPIGMPTVIDRIGTALRKIAIGDLSRYGLDTAAWGPFTSQRPAVIDSGFVGQLKLRRIMIRPEISCFETTDVIYADGTKESIDVVITATGFRTGLEKILKMPCVINDRGKPLFPSGRATSAPGLYFIGFDETVRGQLFEIHQESKQLSCEIDHYIHQENRK